MDLAKKIARLYPRKFREKTGALLNYAHININHDSFLGSVLLANIIISLALALALRLLFELNFIFIFFSSFILIMFIIVFWLIVQSDAAGKFVETILPDALQLMASNLRSGLTTETAFMMSSRPEFGLFKEEIDLIGKEIATGKEVIIALKDASKRIKSATVERAIDLIVSGLKSGGELAELLEQTAKDMRKQAIIDKKIRSNVGMYVIFVFIAVAFGTPILFALSSFLVENLKSSFTNINIPQAALQTASLPLNITAITISSKFLLIYIITFLVVNAILGSMIIGLIGKGREKEGIKNIPIILFLNLSIFFLIKFLLTSLGAGLTP